MSNFQQQYLQKRRTAHDAIELVCNGDQIMVPTGVGEPPELMTALSERRREFRGVRITQLLPIRKFDYYDPVTVGHVGVSSLFFGGPNREHGQSGLYDFYPTYFSELPRLIRDRQIRSDVVFSLASRMDAQGYFAISLATDHTLEAMRHARTVIIESNPNVPYTYGNCHIHVSQISALVESRMPVQEVGLPGIGPVEEAIAHYVADLIPDGATLQIGYGSIPDAVVLQLAHKKDLGVHTELVGDGILSLVESGVVNNRRKNYLPGKMVATFALGSRKLYDFMDLNPMLEMHPVDFTNDPYLAGKNDRLISINATMQVDLVGHCGSESHGNKPYSGTGGQTDFVRAANRSSGGKSFIVMPSTAKGGTISRISATLPQGTHVTTSKNDVNYVVTEYGVAQLRGKSAKARAQELITIAHPDFRDQIHFEARRLKLL